MLSVRSGALSWIAVLLPRRRSRRSAGRTTANPWRWCWRRIVGRTGRTGRLPLLAQRVADFPAGTALAQGREPLLVDAGGHGMTGGADRGAAGRGGCLGDRHARLRPVPSRRDSSSLSGRSGGVPIMPSRSSTPRTRARDPGRACRQRCRPGQELPRSRSRSERPGRCCAGDQGRRGECRRRHCRPLGRELHARPHHR